jgi:tRNA uridine 5-carboxymethylaminomethyl modification enzyme
LRLTPLGRELGLVDDERWERFEERRARLDRNRRALSDHSFVLRSGERVPAAYALRYPDISGRGLAAAGVPLEQGADPAGEEFRTLETEIRYEGYLRREQAEIHRSQKAATQRIPPGFAFRGLPGLSSEVVQRLEEVRPATIGQAARIPGMTAAATVLLSAHLARTATAEQR